MKSLASTETVPVIGQTGCGHTRPARPRMAGSVEKWESKDAQEAFMASRLGAAIAAAGLPAPAQVIETTTVNDQHIDSGSGLTR